MMKKKILTISIALLVIITGFLAGCLSPPTPLKFGEAAFFGCNTAFTSEADLGQYGAYGGTFTSNFTGALDNMTVYIDSYSSTHNYKLQGAIYYANNYTFIANTTNATVGDASGLSWEVLTFADPKPNVINGLQYLFAVDTNASNAAIYIRFNTTTGKWGARDTVANAIYFDDPWVSDNTYTREFCIYVSGITSTGFGQIADILHDSWEYNDTYAAYPDMVRVGNGEYYLITSCGAGSDGYARTIHIDNDTGFITKSYADELEYDTSGGYYQACLHVGGDIYAVAYGTGSATKVRTFTVSETDGNIGDTYIDTVTLSYYGFYHDFIQLTDTIFVVSYANSSNMAGWIETVYIDSEGNIGDAANDSVCYNSTGQYWYGRMCKVDDDTIAVAWDEVTTTDGWIATYNITSTGDISSSYTNRWEFAPVTGFTPYIQHISGTMYAIIYRDSGPTTKINTFDISDNGVITESWIDTCSISADNLFFTMYPVHNPGIYAVTYKNVTIPYWGRISTVNISADGTVGTAYEDTLIFDAERCYRPAPIAYINQSNYFIVWQGVDDDGWCAVVEITTDYSAPTITNPSPDNGTYGIAVTPLCAITIADLNSEDMTITWQENSTASWVTRQVNASVDDGVYRWNFSQATENGTLYWWRVYVDDGLHNVSAIYHFATANASTINYVETTKVISHGLSITPTMISITPINSTINLFLFYVDNINSATFTLHVISAVGATTEFDWVAEYI